MTRFLKTLLLWILIAVVPLNAAAAAAGVFCSTAHQETMQMQAAGDDMSGHAHHGAVDEQPSKATHDEASGNAPAKCSAASAPCIGAAAPPPALVAASPLAGLEILALATASNTGGFIPDGPKRPPRQIAG